LEIPEVEEQFSKWHFILENESRIKLWYLVSGGTFMVAVLSENINAVQEVVIF